MLSQNARLFTHFGIFRKQNAKMLSQNARLLAHFGIFRTHEKYLSVAKAITDLPKFSQAEPYGYFLR
ncbi:hypothetical protein IQ259_16620 [Fortiea sp. LEGE XX443]|uniref:hypothetical protein n=1 Tax=Fortiea sp. LEGE XX443 TaxID=1828611 RepID=UPI00187F3D0C|nr:hypothetical protein [Fortiea sp. LEGE XX443]MBE9006644.1 hypothetical protein [Fortiea sp. LEGE XX443]